MKTLIFAYKVEQTALVSGNFTLIFSATEESRDVNPPSESEWYYLNREILYHSPVYTVYLRSCFLTSMGASWFRRVYSTFQPHVEDFWLPPKSSGNNLKCRLRLRCCRLIDGSCLLTGASTACLRDII